MAPIDTITITDRLDFILSKLKHLKKVLTNSENLSVEDEQSIVERNLELIIQAMIDIGNHILARKFFIRPKS